MLSIEWGCRNVSLKPIRNLRVHGFTNTEHIRKATGVQFFSGETVNMSNIRSGNTQNLELLGVIPPNLTEDWIDFTIKPVKIARYIVVMKTTDRMLFCTITLN